MTRGLLLETTWHEAPRTGTRMYVADVEAWETQSGLRVSAGDAPLGSLGDEHGPG